MVNPAPHLTVGILGIGKLGAPILTRQLDCGLKVVAYDPVAEATASFAERATIVHSAKEVAAASDVVQIVVNDGAQVLEALSGPDGLLDGAHDGLVLLVHSTIDHDTLRAALDACARAGVRLLDAPVSGAMGQFSIPDMCVMVGGDEDAFQVARPVLSTFASLVLHLGPNGRGLDAKLARNAIGYLFYLANLEGLRLTDAAGIDRPTMWRILDHTGLQGQRGGQGGQPSPDSPPFAGAGHTAQVARKDLRAALARAGELGVSMPNTDGSIDQMDALFGVDRLAQP